jgi:Transposase DDE domain group 1
MQLFHTPSRVSASFSDPNLVGSAGLVPLVRLAERCELAALVRRHVDLGVSTGANPAGKVMTIVAGMCVGADSIDDLDMLRTGGTGRLFAVHRHHAFLTDNPLVIEQAEPMHRAHAVIEQVFSDLENGPLGHLPSGRFNANSAWLTLAATAYNLTRAAGTLASAFHAKATGATIRRTRINIPARIASSARRIHLHLPEHWPWSPDFTSLWTNTGHQLRTC